MAYRLGIDIGGTKANIGLLDGDGILLAQKKIHTPSSPDCSAALDAAATAAEGLLSAHGLGWRTLHSVGLGVPGTVDPTGQTVRYAPNLGWTDQPVADGFTRRTGIRPLMVQDGRAGAWGEYLFGAGRGARLLLLITLGTGIGCGLVQNGHIFHGALGTAGEIGHLTVVPGGRICGCGRAGCIEAYASGTGIARTAAGHPAFAGKGLRSEDLFALASRGDPDALGILNEAVDMLGRTVCAAVNLLSPDTLIFSGGMCSQQALFVEPLTRYIRGHAYALAGEAMRIGTATLGGDAPMIGAAFLDLSEGGPQ